jgi:ribulose 1,5-bisphosphate synthetase/thiazole synthase
MTRFAALFFALSLSAHAATQADVIVYGATPGGFCAAIAAAREGASVMLLEPTAHVGGVNTGGLVLQRFESNGAQHGAGSL